MVVSGLATGCDDGFGNKAPCSETYNRNIHFVNPITAAEWRKWTFVGGASMMVSGFIFNSLNSPVGAEAGPNHIKASYKVQW